MVATTAYPLEVFYDGACLVCSTEMERYRRHNPQQRLIFTDISAVDFGEGKYGLSRQQYMAALHVRDDQGNFFTGVDAFLVLWGSFPAGSLYRLFAALISFPGIHLAARTGYSLFARYRHLLPKRSSDCKSGTCHLNHPRS